MNLYDNDTSVRCNKRKSYTRIVIIELLPMRNKFFLAKSFFLSRYLEVSIKVDAKSFSNSFASNARVARVEMQHRNIFIPRKLFQVTTLIPFLFRFFFFSFLPFIIRRNRKHQYKFRKLHRVNFITFHYEKIKYPLN